MAVLNEWVMKVCIPYASDHNKNPHISMTSQLILPLEIIRVFVVVRDSSFS